MSNTVSVAELYKLFLECGKISTDSRKVTKGSIFFALKGDNFDGNRFAASALDSGAAYCVIDDASVAVENDRRYVVVDDVLEALQDIAREHRKKIGIPILAITGSNGKTTTKELVSRVLSKKFNVAATQGNLNNHIGVPLTILSIPADCNFAIIEMGANHCGEIELLCTVAQPNYGIITNIGRAHLEGFGGIEGIISGKGELFDYLSQTEGTALYLSDSKELSSMIDNRPKLKHVGYSARDLEIIPTADNTLTVKFNEKPIRSKLVGDYNRYNIAAAMAVAQYFGVDINKAIAAIESYIPDNGRSERKETAKNILYLDAYNANPSSMKASIENFSTVEEFGFEKVMILGDMRELGIYSDDEHREILNIVAKSGVKNIFLVGQTFCKVNSNDNYHTFATVEDLCIHLKTNPLIKNSILIKGSRGEHLEKTEAFL